MLNDLSSVGIDLDAVTQQLEQEGAEKFVTAFRRLMKSLKEKQVASKVTSMVVDIDI